MEALQRTARSDLLDAVQRLTTARKLSLLELEIETLDDFECFLQPMLQHTSMLTRLWLKNLRIQWLPIGLVLGQCPRLEELHVGCEAHSMGSRLVMTLFAETYVDSSQGGTGAHTDGDLDSGTALSSNKGLETLKLKRLRLKDVLFKESDLRTILDAAPDLYELMIQTMPPPSTPTIPIHMAITDQAPLPADVHTPVSTETRAMGDWISCDRMDFIQDIGLQYPQLTSLHFTRAYHRYTDSQIRTILSSFPRASRWCVVWRDLPDGILRDLNNCVQSASRRAPRDIYLDSGTPHIYTNHLTSLEITPSSDWTPRWGNALHEFLCDSPSLEHLRAGSIAYYIENLDLNGVLPDQEEYHQLLQDDSDGVDDSNPSSSTKPSPQIPSSRRVWACQNLKTLHLEFTRRRHLQHNNAFRSSYADPSASASSSSTHSSTSGNLSSITVLENSPKLSRIVFGYISRFCPRLQDLLIRGYRLNMTLQGGFCLLTRLRELKKVAISQYDCQFRMRDILPWVTKRRSSVTRSQRLRWRAMFAGWWPLIHRKELKCNVPSSVDTGAEQGVEDGAWIGLGVERLGQLSDVVDVLRNLTTISPSLSSSSPQSRSSGQQDLWTDQSDYVWPSLECVRIVYGNRISLERRGDFIRDLLKTHRPEVEFQWVSWLHQYC
ncbi:hypothetical protein BGZ54_008320 [Gamsiella multidivaricata]|nr:hypothetical protein BGZ54_008320 [Gamsiella multidivaricata]